VSEEAALETLPHIINVFTDQSLGMTLSLAFWQGSSGDSPLWLRIAFLVSLILTIIIYLIVAGPPPIHINQTLLTNLVLVGGLATTVLFLVLLFRLNPFPYIRHAADVVGLGQLVNFDTAFAEGLPDALSANIEVVSVERADTDADGFEEWVVFYLFDKRARNSPILGAVYDNDRGNPPVVFPYHLNAPDRNYLSEQQVFGPSLTVQELATDLTPTDNNPAGVNVPELIIQSANELTIFRYRKNSDPWDFPRDAPSRYEPIGFFRGNGGVTINLTQGAPDYGRVNVIDRNGYERSQLAIRSVYGLQIDHQTGNETYLDSIPPLGGVGAPKLAAPLISTVDFYPTPPDDIFNTPYPEKIVLAFYAATCGGLDDTLCRNAGVDGWQPQDFLTAAAMSAFDANNPAYFGLPSFSGNQNISISQLRYHPQLETDPDLLETGGGRDVVTGEQAQENLVDIIFTVNGAPLETRRYEMRLVEGRWKIFRAFRLVTSTLESSNQASVVAVTPPPPVPALTPAPTLPPPALVVPTSTPTQPDCLRNTPPIAEANGPYTGLISQGQALVTFSAVGSIDSDGAIQVYTWDFGDGSPLGSGQSVGHDYARPGVYTTILTVIDNCGASSQDAAKVTIAVPK